MKFAYLRKKYPQFIYENYHWQRVKNNLAVSFDFRIKSNNNNEEIKFKPSLIIKNVTQKQVVKAGESALNNLVFHLGLIEMISYWKATCSPEIIIKPGYLDKKQINWWRYLIEKGMGQFFYENKIDWRQPNFLKIKSSQNFLTQNFLKIKTSQNFLKIKTSQISPIIRKTNNTINSTIVENVVFSKKSKKEGLKKVLVPLIKKVLVPLSGGKDSIVTLEIIKKKKEQGEIADFACFSLNQTAAVRKIIKIANCKKAIFVQRTIDPVLLKLNQQGFLNGHTPFSAYLAFLSVLVAYLFDYQIIAFSNEKSANEGNVKYLNQIINHQWSKSSDFEKRFQWYCQQYLTKKVYYYSLLRPYNELAIAQMFSQYPQYFSVFSSCNVVIANKLKKRWCGQCPKCLFAYTILYPFLDKKNLLKIFGQDLFENKKLLPLAHNLLGKKGFKPFECVGTIKETKQAFQLGLKKAQKSGAIPYLLKHL